MALDFEGGYVSPYLRKFVHDQAFGGTTPEYTVVTMAEAFPEGFQTWEGEPDGAIRCEIVRPDGSWVVGFKEMDTREQRKDRKWYPIPRTPEQFTADCTKALGRALRDAGIPQKRGELQAMMNYLVARGGAGRKVDASMIEGNVNADDIDSPDAGSSDELTLEQEVAVAVGNLGPLKAGLATWARETLGVTNLMRSGDQAPAVAAALQHLERGGSLDDMEVTA